jgi:hypothetical protein
MSRRILPFLIVIAYLAGQLAAVPHTHPEEPAGHVSRSHLHVKGLVSAHNHSHEHHHNHRHSGSHNSPAKSAPVDHDDTCMYLPQAATPALQAKVELSDAAVAYAGFTGNSSPHDTALLDTATSSAPPDVLRSGCDLCLILRTLRI